MRHLILNLESPLMAFGGETIDNYGVIPVVPCGLDADGPAGQPLWAGGAWSRSGHQRLQDRLVFAARIDREPAGGVRLTDYQTVQMGDTVDLYLQDGGWVMGWTTQGTPDKRAGALGTAGSGPFTHQRYRDYFADMRVTVALRLEPDADEPTLDRLAEALLEPARPPVHRAEAVPAVDPRCSGELQRAILPWARWWRVPWTEPVFRPP